MNTVQVMIGFDCDRPRGEYINTTEGKRLAEIKMHSLEYISQKLDKLGIPRTYFLCGQFLESMANQFGYSQIREVFSPENLLCEVADHTYSHNVFKVIPTRPDKIPIPPVEVAKEYRFNTQLFRNIFGCDLSRRGLRAPLGYHHGIADMEVLQNLLLKEEVLYISSDLRDQNHSINPPILDQIGIPRQPYFYACGLLEIPSHGWHDTAFGGHSKTPLFGSCPGTYDQILEFYHNLFLMALAIAQKYCDDFYLGLVLHPYNIAIYDPCRRFFDDLRKLVDNFNLQFCTYRSAQEQLSRLSH